MSDIGFGPVGDPPIVNHYPLEYGYGRKTPLVDRRLLEQAQARIQDWRNKVSSALGVRPGEMNYTTEEAVAKVEDLAVTIQGLRNARDQWKSERDRYKSDLTAMTLERGRWLLESERTSRENERLAAERDHWRAEAEKARTPDASNPKDLRSVADLLERVINVRRSPNTCPDLRAAADRLESEATADDVVEKVDAREVIEHAIRDSSAGPWLQLPGPVDLTPILVTHIHEHLASASLLRGDR
ncbi:hypothetical protein SEA_LITNINMCQUEEN_82 [Gordonia phage LitninMcQueen]